MKRTHHSVLPRSVAVDSMQDTIIIRHCQGIADFQLCARMEKCVWGFADVDVEPVRSYAVAIHLGGQVIGAFDGKALVGFVMALPGVRNGRPYIYSRVLAVDPEYRNAGIGRRLKLAQREDALARGFDCIEWTFDPLEIKNAFFNMERLGAIVRTYSANRFGRMTSSLQGRLPTDRLVAEWWLRSPRVEALLKSEAKPRVPIKMRIFVPAKIADWKTSARDWTKAERIQAKNRMQFEQAFSRGLAVVGCECDAEGNGTFLLGPSNHASLGLPAHVRSRRESSRRPPAASRR
jgi:predicted GNAT superfamily acetyltransferase